MSSSKDTDIAKEIEEAADKIAQGVMQIAAENVRLETQVADLTAALLEAIEVIHVWHGSWRWKSYYENDSHMAPIREVLERPDSVGTYEATDDPND